MSLPKMYIGFLAKYHNSEKNTSETGFFRSADHVRDFTAITPGDKIILQELIDWFDNHMPIPEFYQDPMKRHEDNRTFFWFKDNATEFIDRMDQMSVILEKYGVQVQKLHAKDLPGKLIFEDDCQAVIVPFEDHVRYIR